MCWSAGEYVGVGKYVGERMLVCWYVRVLESMLQCWYVGVLVNVMVLESMLEY